MEPFERHFSDLGPIDNIVPFIKKPPVILRLTAAVSLLLCLCCVRSHLLFAGIFYHNIRFHPQRGLEVRWPGRGLHHQPELRHLSAGHHSGNTGFHPCFGYSELRSWTGGKWELYISVILTGEYFYEQVESGLHRKQFVLADLAFSGFVV